MHITTTVEPVELARILGGPQSLFALTFNDNVCPVFSGGPPRDGGRDGRWRYRFTLATRDTWAHGSRRSAAGRHMRKASWEAHKLAFDLIFAADASAVIRTALATYRGREDYLAKFPATAGKNVGSARFPVRMVETSV